jgi:hypothetical protein
VELLSDDPRQGEQIVVTGSMLEKMKDEQTGKESEKTLLIVDCRGTMWHWRPNGKSFSRMVFAWSNDTQSWVGRTGTIWRERVNVFGTMRDVARFMPEMKRKA